MYNFIDVNEVSDGVVLPSEALKINGAYIEEQIAGYRTLTVSGREALSPDVVSYTTGVRDGSRLKNKRYPERIITVQYQLIAESNEAFREAYNKLAAILNVEDAELIFNDEQDKFFVGTPCTIDTVKPGTNSVVGEFEILCTDPFKYSVIEHEATIGLDEKSILIDYGGTYKSHPTLVAEFYKEDEDSEDGETVKELTGAGDCGYVSFFTEDKKIIQLGDPDEVDGENAYPKAQTLINKDFCTSTDWGTAAKSQWLLNGAGVSALGYAHSGKMDGNVAMGAASYIKSSPEAETSAKLLTKVSAAEKPEISYTITAKAYERFMNSVRVVVSIKAALTDRKNYWRNAGVLIGSVYIGGAWHNVTLKSASDKWESTSAHSKSFSVRVSGLTETSSLISGIKFKAYRNDNLGKTGVLAETACSNLPIPPYVTSTPAYYYLTPSSYGTGDSWHGPSISRTIPADATGDVGAKNFCLSFMNQMEHSLDVSVSDERGYFCAFLLGHLSNGLEWQIAGVTVVKHYKDSFLADLGFYVNGNLVAKHLTNVFDANSNGAFVLGKVHEIEKTGQTIKFNVGGKKLVFNDPEIADLAVTKVTFHFASLKTYTPLLRNGLLYARFAKYNCDTWKEIPNKFGANDVVEADCRNGAIYLNGNLTPALGALGNDWEDFVLKPGLNQIGTSYSEWVDSAYAPKFKVRYREVFL